MESRQRASQEQFGLLLEFMERNGDLSRPCPGLQGRQTSERLWQDLTELLNSVGGNGITKAADKWKRVWSDWKTKTKKKASLINQDVGGTGGGPNRGKPLNPLEERVLQVIGMGAITGLEAVEEAGFDVPPRVPSPIEVGPELWVDLPAPVIPGAALPTPVIPVAAPPTPVIPVAAPQEERSPVSTPRRPRPRRRYRQGPFDRATTEFAAIENRRLDLEAERLRVDSERLQLDRERLQVELERVRVEEKRVGVEEVRVENERLLRESVMQLNNNITALLVRLEPRENANL